MNSNPPLILITGGHMTPAFAVIDELEKRGYTRFIWVGHKYNQHGSKATSPEYNTVTKMGIKFIDLKAGKLVRNFGDNWLSGLENLIKVPWGFIHASWIILRYQPQVIMSFGGYLALPIAVWGRILGKKVITHEQTAVTGLTNKIIPKFAHKILISWPSSAQYYPAAKTVITGNPLRPEVFKSSSSKFNLDPELPTVYITCGNQGSHKINKAIFGILPELLDHANVIHQTGNNSVTRDAETAQSLKTNMTQYLQNRYIHQPFFYQDEIGEVMARSTLVIARSGANTTYEILALGKPSIFIPIPWVTHNEQQRNAEIAAETGIATILSETELSPDTLLKSTLSALEMIYQKKSFLNTPLPEAQAAAHAVVIPNAAQKIVVEIEKLIK